MKLRKELREDIEAQKEEQLAAAKEEFDEETQQIRSVAEIAHSQKVSNLRNSSPLVLSFFAVLLPPLSFNNILPEKEFSIFFFCTFFLTPRLVGRSDRSTQTRAPRDRRRTQLEARQGFGRYPRGVRGTLGHRKVSAFCFFSDILDFLNFFRA
jgi:hypothetical protein